MRAVPSVEIPVAVNLETFENVRDGSRMWTETDDPGLQPLFPSSGGRVWPSLIFFFCFVAYGRHSPAQLQKGDSIGLRLCSDLRLQSRKNKMGKRI